MPHTNNKEVERIEEIIENIVAGVAEYPHGRLALAVDLREQLRTILHQELQKAREEERKLVTAEIIKRYWLNPKRSKSDVAKDNAWNDLGNTLRNGV